MRSPAIFISSTCYDLKQLRADLHSYLEAAGFEPVLSEFPNFPVDPDQTTIENCRKVVESRADVFVLVIGGRYGSINEQGKSVTNLEYLTAKAKGIPMYVFVMQSILELLPTWRDNPGGNFSATIDSPNLLQFVAEIRNSGEKWVFPFNSAQDIISILRTQLTYLFADALDLRLRASTSGTLLSKFSQLSGRELRLIIEKPLGWEYRLLSEGLRREIFTSADLRRDWSYNLALGSERMVKPSEFFQLIREKNSEAVRISTNLKTLFHDALPIALGPSGQPGDAEGLSYVASRFGENYRSLLKWKLDYFCLRPPDEFLQLRTLAAGLCDDKVPEIEEFVARLATELVEALNRTPGGPPRVLELTLTLSGADQTPLNGELARLSRLIESGELQWN